MSFSTWNHYHGNLLTNSTTVNGLLSVVSDQKVKDPCVCNKPAEKECNQGTKKSKRTEKCNSPCKDNKECKNKDQLKKCPYKSQADQGKKCKSVETAEGEKKCNCKCKEGEAKQSIPKPGAAVSGALQPVPAALSAQHGIGKKINSSKKCCCDCGHDCCCDCCHDCCCDCCHDCCCHDCCHDCCCHCCCEPCCCCHCCEPCCCCHECCCPCCCHCCHHCCHCPCCCGCCKKSKAQLSSAALAAAAAAAASRPEHHWRKLLSLLLGWLKLIFETPLCKELKPCEHYQVNRPSLVWYKYGNNIKILDCKQSLYSFKTSCKSERENVWRLRLGRNFVTGKRI